MQAKYTTARHTTCFDQTNYTNQLRTDKTTPLMTHHSIRSLSASTGWRYALGLAVTFGFVTLADGQTGCGYSYGGTASETQLESTGGTTQASSVYTGGLQLGTGNGLVEGWAVWNLPLTYAIGDRATSYTQVIPQFFGQDTSWYPNSLLK